MADVFRWLAEAAGGQAQGSSSLHLEVNNSNMLFSCYSQHPIMQQNEALIHGLNIAISLGIKRLMVYGDSLVVISQINKEWDCSNGSMGKYCIAVRKLKRNLKGWNFIM
jgi:hypothetical protein